MLASVGGSQLCQSLFSPRDNSGIVHEIRSASRLPAALRIPSLFAVRLDLWSWSRLVLLGLDPAQHFAEPFVLGNRRVG